MPAGRNLDRLSAVSGCILIAGKVEAFTLGEPLNDDTIAIHLEKANAAFVTASTRSWPSSSSSTRAWHAYADGEQDPGVGEAAHGKPVILSALHGRKAHRPAKWVARAQELASCTAKTFASSGRRASHAARQ